jgi:hypothetical protein
MNARIAQLLRAGKLVGTGFVGSREQIKEEALAILEDAEQQVREYRRRRALNGAIEVPPDAGDVPPCSAPAAPPAPAGAIILRRRP